MIYRSWRLHWRNMTDKIMVHTTLGQSYLFLMWCCNLWYARSAKQANHSLYSSHKKDWLLVYSKSVQPKVALLTLSRAFIEYTRQERKKKNKKKKNILSCSGLTIWKGTCLLFVAQYSLSCQYEVTCCCMNSILALFSTQWRKCKQVKPFTFSPSKVHSIQCSVSPFLQVVCDGASLVLWMAAVYPIKLIRCWIVSTCWYMRLPLPEKFEFWYIWTPNQKEAYRSGYRIITCLYSRVYRAYIWTEYSLNRFLELTILLSVDIWAQLFKASLA